jgi:hypothetical protein
VGVVLIEGRVKLVIKVVQIELTNMTDTTFLLAGRINLDPSIRMATRFGPRVDTEFDYEI